MVRARVGDPGLLDRLGGEPFDLVLSDLSPRISGAYATDHARSADLVRQALALAVDVLRPGGAFAAKVFDGDLVARLEEEAEAHFVRVHRTKPPASAGASSELYLVAVGFRPARRPDRGAKVPRAPDI